MPKVANGPDLDFNLGRARSENIELELRPVLHKERTTVLRFLSYMNHANMGSYREAIRAFRAGIDPLPSIEAHRRQGRIKYGFGFSLSTNSRRQLASLAARDGMKARMRALPTLR